MIVPRWIPAKMDGPIRIQLSLARALAERGHESIIYTTDCDVFGFLENTPRREVMDKIVVKRYHPWLRRGHYIVTPNMLPDLIREEADIIHVLSYRNFQTDLGALLSKLKEKPLVLSSMGGLVTFKYISKSRMEWIPYYFYDLLTLKSSIRMADFIVVSTKHEALDAAAFGVPREKIRVIPPGVEVPSYATRLQTTFEKTILYVGRITPVKNLEFLIRGFKLVTKEIPEARLIIVGELHPTRYDRSEVDYDSKLLTLCKTMNISDKVLFTGGLYAQDSTDPRFRFWKVFSSCKVFVYTSQFETFGLAFVEAGLLGKPIISTRVGIAPDLIGDDQAGTLIDHNDVLGLKNAIVTLISDDDLYKRKQSAILNRVKSYSVNAMVKKYEQLYNELISDTFH